MYRKSRQENDLFLMFPEKKEPMITGTPKPFINAAQTDQLLFTLP